MAGKSQAVISGQFGARRNFRQKEQIIEPQRAARSSLAFGATILRDGKNLIWFPEGERSTSGELKDFKPGIGMLLERFPASIIPVFLHGTHEALPPGKHLPDPILLIREKIDVVISSTHRAELLRRS